MAPGLGLYAVVATKHKPATMLVVIVALLVVTGFAPAIALSAAGWSAAASPAMLAGISALIACLLGHGWRTGLTMAAPFAVFAGLAVWASPNAWLAAVVLASAAFLRGYAAKVGMHNALVMALISLGFIVAVPPSPDTVLAAPIFIAAVCLVAGLWATLVTFMLRNQLSAPDHQHLESIRVLAFSIALAFLVGVATWFVVAFDLGHTGAWIILTIVIVFQPSLGAGFKKAGSRAVGTVLGILAAIAIGAVFPAGPFLYVIGAGALITALYFTLVARPYWWFAASLTLAIVLLESAGSTVEQTAEDRLVATLIGLAGTVAVLLVLSPLSKHLAAGIRPSPSN